MVKRIGMCLLALVAGYAVMFLLITIVQEGVFGGVVYGETPLTQLVLAGVLTMFSAVVGGWVAARVFGKPYFPPALIMCALVLLETVYMTLAGRLPGPVWFDFAASSSLVVGIILGVILFKRGMPVSKQVVEASA